MENYIESKKVKLIKELTVLEETVTRLKNEINDIKEQPKYKVGDLVNCKKDDWFFRCHELNDIENIENIPFRIIAVKETMVIAENTNYYVIENIVNISEYANISESAIEQISVKTAKDQIWSNVTK